MSTTTFHRRGGDAPPACWNQPLPRGWTAQRCPRGPSQLPHVSGEVPAAAGDRAPCRPGLPRTAPAVPPDLHPCGRVVHSAGLLHDQPPRLIVPRLDVELPIQIDAAVRHMAQINRRATAAAEALQLADHFRGQIHVVRLHMGSHATETSRPDGVHKIRNGRSSSNTVD